MQFLKGKKWQPQLHFRTLFIFLSHLGGLFQRLDGLVLLLELGPVMQVVHALRRPQLPMQPTAPLRIMILEMALQERKGAREGLATGWCKGT